MDRGIGGESRCQVLIICRAVIAGTITGTAAQASKFKPILLEAMYQHYLKGELYAKVN